MYKYTHFIPENISPFGSEKIGVYDGNNKRICSIPLGRLTLPETDKLYSFCALSDTHLTYDTANEDFQRALTFAESNCDFTCIAGDLTSTGAESEMTIYKNIVDTYAKTKPVYAITGNHENFSTISQSYLQNYTGQPLYYSFTKGNDVFIMLGHYGGYGGDGVGWLSSEFVSVEELQWLYETLEANRNKRCFVFSHVLPHEHGVGNPNGLYKSALIWKTTDNGIGQALISLLQHYKNVVFFHGHSHTKFWLQEVDKKANYSNENGYRSVHIPSLAVPRDLSADGTGLETIYAESEGYIVDVYENFIVLNAMDFINNECVPIGVYKIDTALQTIEAGTFVDSTET